MWWVGFSIFFSFAELDLSELCKKPEPDFGIRFRFDF
jgi:hypothetical protein